MKNLSFVGLAIFCACLIYLSRNNQELNASLESIQKEYEILEAKLERTKMAYEIAVGSDELKKCEPE